MKLLWRDLGDELLQACNAARAEAVVIAPFMTAAAFEKITDQLARGVALTCVTRWRLEEICAGVSDVECRQIALQRDSARFLLFDTLHAKYYRFDHTVFIGSANITSAALGWRSRPNAEVLLRIDVGDLEHVLSYERELISYAFSPNEELASELLDAAQACRPAHQEPAEATMEFAALGSWVPECRSPAHLFSVYSRPEPDLSSDAVGAARRDLAKLELPPGLTAAMFHAIVRSRLAVLPIVVALDAFLCEERRFGEIRRWLAKELGVSDGTDGWQRLMRWLLYFNPQRYRLRTPNYSEIFCRIGSHTPGAE